ncbi:hypothetical protein [Halorientalis halophila]|uniref:hypothetical protein n=1 Tax=Halorientalis halophila TaxID=3108499 RepID=UPI0030081565
MISRLITYGDKIAQLALVGDLPEDLTEKVTEKHPEMDEEGDDSESTNDGDREDK